MSSLPSPSDRREMVPAPPADPRQQAVDPAGAGGPPCVAVLENHGDTRTLLVEILSDAGFVVDAAADPRALPEWWHGDVIVTDSFETKYCTAAAKSVVRDLRARHGVPIVFLSGHAGAKADEALIGADAVVLKPFDIDELVATIRRVVARTVAPHA